MIEKEQVTLAGFGTPFQEKLAQLILDDNVFADQVSEVLQTNFFELKYLQEFVDIIFNYREQYKKYPSRATIESILKSSVNKLNPAIQKQVRDYYTRLVSEHLKNVNEEYVKEKSLDFCRKQTLKGAMLKSVQLMEDSSFDEIEKLINNALKLGSNNEQGYEFIKHFEERYKLRARNPVTTGWDVIDGYTRGGLGKGELGVCIAPTGCHARGTEIMLYNGSLVKVEDVKVGDYLMGPDSNPRLVKQLYRGNEKMYKITPVKGESFIVNENHILSLKRTTNHNDIVNLSVKEYLTKSNTFKHEYKLYRVGVEFERQRKELLVDPYITGIMLGDGSVCNSNVSFTSADSEVVTYFQEYANKQQLKFTEYKKEGSKASNYNVTFKLGQKNPLLENFRYYGIDEKRSGNKSIPFEYKTSSRDERLQLLAGLLDTDGSYSRGGYDFISKSEQLSRDVVYVARSLGLAAYITNCIKSCQNGYTGDYWRVSISGDCSIIPCKIRRKIAEKRKQKKNVLVTGFSVEEIGNDDFYGFELDGDHLYLMGDFTVTHNSGKSMALVHLGAKALMAGKNVVYYTLELQDTVIGLRFDSCLTGYKLDSLHGLKDDVYDEIKDVPGSLVIKEYPTKSASTATIRSHLNRLKQRGFRVDMVIVDYGDLLRPTVKEKEKRGELQTIYEELRGIAGEFECPLWTASQTNRSGLNAEVITMESISEAFNKCFVADFIFSISRTVSDKQNNSGRAFIAKNRNGPDGIVCPIFMDTSNVEIKVFEPTGESLEDIKKNVAKIQKERLAEKYSKYKSENE